MLHDKKPIFRPSPNIRGNRPVAKKAEPSRARNVAPSRNDPRGARKAAPSYGNVDRDAGRGDRKRHGERDRKDPGRKVSMLDCVVMLN